MIFIEMENNLTRRAAEYLLAEYHHLIGQPMPYPCNEQPITTISIVKDKNTQGYSVVLSNDFFDGDCRFRTILPPRSGLN